MKMEIQSADDEQTCEHCGTPVQLMDVVTFVRQFAPDHPDLPRVPERMWMETVVSGTFTSQSDGAVLTLSQREHSTTRCRRARR